MPQPGAQLPTSPVAFDPAQLQAKGVFPDNMCRLVAVTDRLAAAAAPAESFTTVRTARFGEVLGGVSFTPGTVSRRR